MNQPPKNPPSDRLELLYQLAQTFNSSLDLDQVLNRVMDEVIATMNAERGFVMLYDENSVLTCRVARNISRESIEDKGFRGSRSMVEKSAREGIPILAGDAQTDDRFSGMQSVQMFGLRSVLCVPLKVKEQKLGAIFVDNRMQKSVFTHSDQNLLEAIASSAAIAIENARLYALAVEKGRLEREFQMAREVQRRLLPDHLPEVPGWEFSARWTPARQVAGDFYDFFPLTGRPSSPMDLGVLVADVTDKGMPAALFMALTRTTLRASLTAASTPKEGIAQANRLITADSPQSMFVTVFFLRLSPSSSQITYVNCGHNPPIFYRSASQSLEYLTRTGMVLGIDESTLFQEVSVELKTGDSLLLYTDGVTDAMNSSGESFGTERLEEVFRSSQDQNPTDILSAIEGALSQFTGDIHPFDDITLVLLRRTSNDQFLG
jgi:phosphoserine phosphatase RsbU/P